MVNQIEITHDSEESFGLMFYHKTHDYSKEFSNKHKKLVDKLNLLNFY